MILGLVYGYIPFFILPLYAALDRIDKSQLEASRDMGASPASTFWRVTLPQIATTIGVVVTTLIVLVMKVFDIIKVMTNGQFGTQVLANDMYQQAFQNSLIGYGTAIALVLLVVYPAILVLNGLSPLKFFAGVWPAMQLGFVSRSSIGIRRT